MVPPPLGTPARAIHTTKVRKWQYPYGQALAIAGPRLNKKTTRTQVNTEATSETMRMPLPMALRLQPPPRNPLPPFASTDEGKRMLAYSVANISDPGHQNTMETEADVIQEAGPYFLKVVQDLAPYYLASSGLRGKFTVHRESTNDKSRPDVIMKYNGKTILALDYKGPNCIHTGELQLCSATSPSDALKRLQQSQAEAADAKKKGRPLKNPADQANSLCYDKNVNQFTRALLKQGLKYRVKFGAPVVVFYDYNNLMAMEPPADLKTGNQSLMDVVLCTESAKSTEGNLVALPDNHVVVLLRYVLMAARKYGERGLSV